MDKNGLIEKLKAGAKLPDENLDIAEISLILAAIDQPGISLDRYREHLKKLVNQTAKVHKKLCADDVQDSAEIRIEALRNVLVGEYEYHGDIETYDDLQNASLIRVIERRKGMPITLSILYIHVARSLGWAVYGLNVPGHFLVRLDYDGARVIFDPFNDCAILHAPDLRQLIKDKVGPNAELSSSYFEPALNLDILIRLQNNIKTRRIEGEDYEGALETVLAMRALAPDEYRLLLDEGVLCARTNRPQQASIALEAYIDVAPYDHDRREAAMLLQQVKQSLN